MPQVTAWPGSGRIWWWGFLSCETFVIKAGNSNGKYRGWFFSWPSPLHARLNTECIQCDGNLWHQGWMSSFNDIGNCQKLVGKWTAYLFSKYASILETTRLALSEHTLNFEKSDISIVIVWIPVITSCKTWNIFVKVSQLELQRQM